MFDFNFHSQKLVTNCVPLTCTIADDICLVKETPTIFCISRRLECSFRRFVLESLYSEKFKKIFKSGEDQNICTRVQKIVNKEEEQLFQTEGKMRQDQYKLDELEKKLKDAGIVIMVLKNARGEEVKAGTQPNTAQVQAKQVESK